MSQKQLTQIVSILPELTETELGDLAKRISVLRQFKNTNLEPEDSDEKMVLHCISQLMVRKLGAPPSIYLMQRSASEKIHDGSSFREKIPGLALYLRRAVPSRSHQLSLLSIGLDFLYAQLVNECAAISFKTLMANVHRIPGLIDREFPGYAASGLLEMVVGSRGVEKHGHK